MSTEEKIEKVKEILSSNGIKLYIDGCGCCGSPNVKFEYKGEMIIEQDGLCFTMFDEHELEC